MGQTGSPRGAVEDVGERGLRHLRQRLDGLAVHHDVHDVRGGADVVVPDAVVDGLEVPDTLAGLDVEADDALGVDVVAEALAAVVVVRRRRQRDVDVAEFLVGGEHGPGVGVALHAPGFVLPGLGERLALLRDGVEAPLELAGADVVRPDVARRVFVLRDEVEDLRPHDDRVADHDRRRAVGDVVPVPVVDAEVAGEVDHAVVAEGRIRLAGGRVDGHELLAGGGDENALGLAVGPVLDAAGAARQHGRQSARPATRVVEPELLAGGRVQGGHLTVRCDGVHLAADHQRRRGEVACVVGALESAVR